MSFLRNLPLDARRRLHAALAGWTGEIRRAREEYREHPIAAIEEDWCVNCCYPRRLRRCHMCTSVMAIRRRRAS